MYKQNVQWCRTLAQHGDIYYNDINAANIMFSNDDTPVIVDLDSPQYNGDILKPKGLLQRSVALVPEAHAGKAISIALKKLNGVSLKMDRQNKRESVEHRCRTSCLYHCSYR